MPFVGTVPVNRIVPALGPSPPKSSFLKTVITVPSLFWLVEEESSIAVGISFTELTVIVTDAIEILPSASTML